MSDQEEDFPDEFDENDLDEEDQNDDADVEDQDQEENQDENQDDQEEQEPENEMIYSPLRTLKIRDGDHVTIVIVSNDDRKTSDVICDSEYTEAIGIRASQIERGSPVFTDVTGIRDPIIQAKKEFYDRASPLVLERVIEKRGNVWRAEHWKVREMTFPIRDRSNVY